MQKQDNRIRVNGYIRASRVKVVNEAGDFLGEFDTWQAIKMAQEQGMDLVEVNAKSNPPLAKIINLGKFKYEAKKQQAELKKKQKIQETKYLYLHINTENNDVLRLIDRAKEFLTDNHKVSFTIKMRGRENSHKDLAEEKLKGIVAQLHGHIVPFPSISLENRNMSVMLLPVK